MLNDTSNPEHASAHEPAQTSPQKGAPWGGWAATIVVIVVFLLAQVAGAYLLELWPYLHSFSHAEATTWLNSVGGQFFYVAITEGLTLTFLWFFVRRFRGKSVRQALGIGRHGQWEDVAYAFIGVIVYFALYLMVLSAVTSVVHINVDQKQDVGFNTVRGSGPLLLTFVSLVVLPPIVEELTFRGFLYSGLKRRMGIIGAALLTSILFAAPHLLESDGGGLLWSAGIDTFTLSLVLCYLREKTGAIYAGIGVHSLKNLIAFISLYLVHIR